MSDETLSENEKQNIISCIRSGRKIEAIRLYREATGASLVDAKHVIEKLAAKLSGDPPPFAETGENEIAALLISGKEIAAIKLYREKTGAGLKEAKEKVEALAESLNLAQHPMAQKKASGCGLPILMSVTFAAVAFAKLLGV